MLLPTILDIGCGMHIFYVAMVHIVGDEDQVIDVLSDLYRLWSVPRRSRGDRVPEFIIEAIRRGLSLPGVESLHGELGLA